MARCGAKPALEIYSFRHLGCGAHPHISPTIPSLARPDRMEPCKSRKITMCATVREEPGVPTSTEEKSRLSQCYAVPLQNLAARSQMPCKARILP